MRKGIQIPDNTQEVVICPNCGDRDERYVNIINTPKVNGKRTKIYTWTCYGCDKELVSFQDN